MPDQSKLNQQSGMPPYPPYYPPPQPRRTRWWIPVLIIVVILGIFTIPVFVLLGLAGSAFTNEPVEVRNNSVLYLNLGEKLEEHTGGGSIFEAFGEKSQPNFFEVLQSIKRAKGDDRIKGIYYKARGTAMGFAKNIELIEAINDFRKSGKFVYAYIDMGTEADYMRALPADKIFMPSEGMVELNGFGVNSMFFKGMLDKVGIEFHVEHFEDFKSAAESFNRKGFSDSARKQLRIIVQQRHRNFVDAIANYRKLDKEMINEVLNRGVYTADSLKALGFVDSLMTEADLKDMLKNMTNKNENDSKKHKLRLVDVSDYMNADFNDDKPVPDKDIAIIFASGTIVDQASGGMNSEKQITKKLAEYIRKAREDKKIKAIILRVDSPGGSVMTSDIIWQEVMKTRGVKPIYASMSDVAASGGYYIAMACDTIIAHPATITGSIGVIAAIPNFSGLLGKLDITSDTISSTKATQELSFNYPFNQAQKNKLHDMIQGVYFRFVNKVAESRKKTFDETRSLAKGRVWTGEDAKKMGLVDVLGGLQDAINITKARIGVPAGKKVFIKEYPVKEDPFDMIFKLFGKKDSDDEVSINKVIDGYFSRGNSTYTEIYNNMPEPMKRQMDYMRTLLYMSYKDPVMIAMPNYIEIR